MLTSLSLVYGFGRRKEVDWQGRVRRNDSRPPSLGRSEGQEPQRHAAAPVAGFPGRLMITLSWCRSFAFSSLGFLTTACMLELRACCMYLYLMDTGMTLHNFGMAKHILVSFTLDCPSKREKRRTKTTRRISGTKRPTTVKRCLPELFLLSG